MNNNIVKFALVGIVCAEFCIAAVAAPKGGNRGSHGGGGGRPAARQERPHHAAKPAVKPNVAHHVAKPAAKPNVAHHAAKPAAKPSPAKHAAPVHQGNRHAVARHEHPTPHHSKPGLVVRRHIPSNARYCARPAVPMWRFGALRAWEWIEDEWLIIVNGVCYYGDGYYFDGFNYYYNGAYHSAPPPSIYVA